MEEKQLRQRLAGNITFYRKKAGLTQAELADMLSYSDKSVSKWERGDGLPDINVLVRMTEIFKVSLDDMISEKPCADSAEGEEKIELPPDVLRRNRIIKTLLSVGLVWFIASVFYFIFKLIFPASALVAAIFLLAVPVSFIVAIVMVSLWWGMGLICTMVSGLVWSLAVCVDVLLPMDNSGLIYLVAAVFQLLIILWYCLKSRPELLHLKSKEEKEAQQEKK